MPPAAPRTATLESYGRRGRVSKAWSDADNDVVDLSIDPCELTSRAEAEKALREILEASMMTCDLCEQRVATPQGRSNERTRWR